MNSDGSIVALTGTHFSFNGHDRTGGVEVWQYNDTTWNQLGKTLLEKYNLVLRV